MLFDFVRCQRADGSHYGTAGKCQKGREVDALLEKIVKRGNKVDETGLRDAFSKGNVRFLGEGSFGEAYSVGGGVVVKLGHMDKNEVDVMDKLKNIEGVPRILSENVKSGGNVLAMTKMEGKNLADLVDEGGNWGYYAEGIDKALPILKKMHELNIAHNDVHMGNVLYDPQSEKASLIDFGNASLGVKDSLMEVFKLKRSMSKSLSEISKDADMEIEDYLSGYGNLYEMTQGVDRVLGEMKQNDETMDSISNKRAKDLLNEVWKYVDD